MGTTAVGPGELDKAIAAAKAGDTLVIHGDQPGVQRNLSKQLFLEGAGDEMVHGRLVLQANGIIFHQLHLNGAGGPTDYSSSWTVVGNGCQILACDLTNEHWAIGINTYGGGDDLIVEHNLIHAIGKLKSAGTSPPWAGGDQPYQHKDGQWSGNHDHGIYLTALRAIVRENIIRDCSDRAVQLKGSQHTIVERNLGFDCGMGIIFGDGADSFDVAQKNLWLDNQIVRRALIETYQAGQSDSAGDWAWNADGRPAIAASGVNVTACKTGDPKFDRATMMLAAGSPAVGYGPTRIQAGVTPPPPPHGPLDPKVIPDASGDLWLHWTPDPAAKGYVIHTPTAPPGGVLHGVGTSQSHLGKHPSIIVSITPLHPNANDTETVSYP